MDQQEMAERYLAAWNQRDASAILDLTHAQVSYYDAFWSETASGPEFARYLQNSLDSATHWYRRDGDYLLTLNGLVMRFLAFHQDDVIGETPLFNGAEILTFSDGLIMTISDYYCDPEPVDLMELAGMAEKQHGQANVAPLGLSAKTSGRIKRQLMKFAADQTVFLNPSLTVTRLADYTGCSVMHLFHVLEEEMDKTFSDFVNEARARFASSLLVESVNGELDYSDIASQCGFESATEFRQAFQNTFADSPEDYSRKFAKT